MTTILQPSDARCHAFLSRPNTYVLRFPTDNVFYFSLPLEISSLQDLRAFELFSLKAFLSSIVRDVQHSMGQGGVDNISNVQSRIEKRLLHLKHLLNIEKHAWVAGYGIPVFNEQDNLVSFSWNWNRLHFEKGPQEVAKYAGTHVEQRRQLLRKNKSIIPQEHFQRVDIHLEVSKMERTNAFRWICSNKVICFGIYGAWFKDEAEWQLVEEDFNLHEVALLESGMARLYNRRHGGMKFVVSEPRCGTSPTGSKRDAADNVSVSATNDQMTESQYFGQATKEPSSPTEDEQACIKASVDLPGKTEQTPTSPGRMPAYTVVLNAAIPQHHFEYLPFNIPPLNSGLDVLADAIFSLKNSSNTTAAKLFETHAHTEKSLSFTRPPGSKPDTPSPPPSPPPPSPRRRGLGSSPSPSPPPSPPPPSPSRGRGGLDQSTSQHDPSRPDTPSPPLCPPPNSPRRRPGSSSPSPSPPPSPPPPSPSRRAVLDSSPSPSPPPTPPPPSPSRGRVVLGSSSPSPSPPPTPPPPSPSRGRALHSSGPTPTSPPSPPTLRPNPFPEPTSPSSEATDLPSRPPHNLPTPHTPPRPSPSNQAGGPGSSPSPSPPPSPPPPSPSRRQAAFQPDTPSPPPSPPPPSPSRSRAGFQPDTPSPPPSPPPPSPSRRCYAHLTQQLHQNYIVAAF